MNKLLKGFLVGIVATFLVAGSAAALTITLDDGADGSEEVIIKDGGVDDQNALSGIVQFDGNVGNWDLNTTIGTSYPALGTSTSPQLDLFSLSLDYLPENQTVFGGVIAITASESYANFGELDEGIAGFIASIGGVTVGTVDFFININGVALEILWDDMVKPGGGAFAGSIGMSLADHTFADSDVWDMSLEAIVTQGSGITTLNANIQPVPEPATMLLLGMGLLGLAGITRKRTKA